jgi:hypothetical protein
MGTPVDWGLSPVTLSGRRRRRRRRIYSYSMIL